MKNSLVVKNGIWYGIIYYKDQFGRNKQKWISTGLKERGNKREAQKIIDKECENLDLYGENIQKNDNPVVKNDIIFMDYMRDYVENKKKELSPPAYDAYMCCVKIMGDYFGNNLKLKDVTVKHIEDFFDYLRDVRGNKNITVKHHAIILSPALRQAYRDDLIAKNPCEFLAKIKKEKSPRSYYNADEIEKLFEIIKDDQIEFIVKLAVYYGFRRSEILGLKWQAINFNDKTITIEHKVLECKGGLYASNTLKTLSSNRTLPLLPVVEDMLLKHKANIEYNKLIYGKCYNPKYLDYICVNELGDLFLPNYVTNHFRKLLIKNKMRHIRFHDLRHSCASLLVANGVPMKNIQEWLGHSNFNTTADVYSHVDFSAKIESAKIIDKTITRNNDAEKTKKEDISDEEFEEFLEWRRRKKLQQDSEM